ELRAGPRFVFSPGDINGVTIKPYVVATGATLADAAYMGGIGGGLTLPAAIGNVSLDPYGGMVQQSVRHSSVYPLASGLSGTLSTVGLQASTPIKTALVRRIRSLALQWTSPAGIRCRGRHIRPRPNWSTITSLFYRA